MPLLYFAMSSERQRRALVETGLLASGPAVHNAHACASQFILPTDAAWFQQLIKAFNSAFRWGQISKSLNVRISRAEMRHSCPTAFTVRSHVDRPRISARPRLTISRHGGIVVCVRRGTCPPEPDLCRIPLVGFMVRTCCVIGVVSTVASYFPV